MPFLPIESLAMAYETSLSLLDRLKDPANLHDWQMFVEIYEPFIHRHLQRFSITGQDIEDLSQEALIVAFRMMPDFQHNGRAGAFRKWLREVVHYRALNHLKTRRQMPRPLPMVGSNLVDQMPAVAELERQWDHEHDAYILQRLLTLIEPEFTRTTWTAFYDQTLGGKGAQQTASELGISVNAALIAKSRVLSHLRQLSAGLIDECD